jgi:hypothetical protein
MISHGKKRRKGMVGVGPCDTMSIPPLMTRTDSTPVQSSGTWRNPRRSTIPAQILPQSIPELETPSSALLTIHHLAHHAAFQKPGYPSPIHMLMSKPSSHGILSLELSNTVVDVLVKDHILESCTHCIAAI